MLIKTPIKEIIFGISFAENVPFRCIEEFRKKELIQEHFPEVKDSITRTIAENTNEVREPSLIEKKAGYVFLRDKNQNRVLQAKLGAFFYHKFKDYTGFDVLMKELDGYWVLFQECAGKLSITSVSLKYTNLIKKEEGELKKDLININVNHPFGDIEREYKQLNFTCQADNSVQVVVIAADVKDENGDDGILLDINLKRTINSQTFDNISVAFEGMRAFKNELYDKAVTEQTKMRYNG